MRNNSYKKIKWLQRTFLFAMVFFIGTFLKAQDPHFSQYYESPLTLNPALCGLFKGSQYYEINYRSQWSNVMGGNGYNTMEATFELHNILNDWKKGYLSQGFSCYSDKSGDAKEGITEITYTAATGIYLNRNNILAIGLQAGEGQRSINFTNMQWGEQYVNGNYDPTAVTGEQTVGNSIWYTDLSGGLSYSYSSGLITQTSNDGVKANIGLGVFHINQPDISYYRSSTEGSSLYMRYDLHGYLDFGVKQTNLSFQPGFSYYMQGPSTELNTGITVRSYLLQPMPKVGRYNGTDNGATTFDVGLYYRWNDAVILTMGLKLKAYAFGISYDMSTTNAYTNSSGRGAIEISVKYIK